MIGHHYRHHEYDRLTTHKKQWSHYSQTHYGRPTVCQKYGRPYLCQAFIWVDRAVHHL